MLGLGLTALFQLAIVLRSGSVGLLADTIHNVGDALTAVPLGIAFVLGRRPADRRYTYGYGRAEDLAGTAIVAIIFASAAVAAYESIQKLVHAQPLSNLGWVMAAAVVGFLGNEAVAVFRIRVGREVGSAALIADGQHARADGFTSLAVLAGALGALAGFPLADPIVGLLITLAILAIVKDTAVAMGRRLMDAIEPGVVEAFEFTPMLLGKIASYVVEGPERQITVFAFMHPLHVSWEHGAFDEERLLVDAVRTVGRQGLPEPIARREAVAATREAEARAPAGALASPERIVGHTTIDAAERRSARMLPASPADQEHRPADPDGLAAMLRARGSGWT